MSNPNASRSRPHPLHPTADVSLERTIGKKITVQPDGCWIWNGTTSRHGYGRHSSGGYIHRFVWATLKGEIPEDMVVHHTCGVKPCCNPDHLELMTMSEHSLHHSAERHAS